jgi:hypothetical protein
MTLNEFKIKHQDLIKRGIVRFSKELPKIEIPAVDKKTNELMLNILSEIYNNDVIIIDRFTDDLQTILGEAKELVTARNDAKKMGYVNIGVGVYSLM